MAAEAEKRITCEECGKRCTYLPAIPKFHVNAEWVHVSDDGRWRYRGGHTPVPVCPECGATDGPNLTGGLQRCSSANPLASGCPRCGSCL